MTRARTFVRDYPYLCHAEADEQEPLTFPRQLKYCKGLTMDYVLPPLLYYGTYELFLQINNLLPDLLFVIT